MAIRRLQLRNFKSFNALDVKLGDFNVLIGANAAGKSNFTQAFKFMRDIQIHGLDNAVSLQGGVEFLRNINLGANVPFCLEALYDDKYLSPMVIRDRAMGRLNVEETVYRFELGFKKTRLGFEITGDSLVQKGIYRDRSKPDATTRAEIAYSISNRLLKEEVKIFGGDGSNHGRLLPSLSLGGGRFRSERWDKKTLLLQTTLPRMPVIGVYDIDPKLPKKATPITGKADLDEDGANLAIVVKRIVSNPRTRRQFANLVKDLLPFINNVSIEKFSDRSLLFKLKEEYFKRRDVPASSISDGTINIVALIAALYFEDRKLIIVEEPERNIHPSLISKVVGMMKEASKSKQVVVTTQNPEVVKYAGLENLLFVSRDEQGFSDIFRLSDTESVKAFLQNDIGIEELYIQNLIGVTA
ncbi:MAG: AAA family ATPase [Nitrospira sp.]|nr:AAA family ATPase [Nitrospira sp.]